jgi:3-deoxy-D-manno-octulosonic acid kinase
VIHAAPPPRADRPLLPSGFAWLERADCIAALDADWRVSLEATGLLEPRALQARLAEADRGPASGPRGRAAIAIIGVPDRPERIAVRGLRRGGWLGSVFGARLPGPGRPFRELATTARLRAVGAPVPRPVFALAWRHGWAWNAALGTGFVEHAIDAGTLLARGASRESVRATLCAAGHALRHFHDAGGSHPDLHVGNLLVRDRGDTPEVLVIDLDRARADAVPSPAQRMDQLMRLYRSLHKRSLLAAVGGERGALRFLRAYVADDLALRRGLLACLPAERRRLARHTLLYRRAGRDSRSVR